MVFPSKYKKMSLPPQTSPSRKVERSPTRKEKMKNGTQIPKQKDNRIIKPEIWARIVWVNNNNKKKTSRGREK